LNGRFFFHIVVVYFIYKNHLLFYILAAAEEDANVDGGSFRSRVFPEVFFFDDFATVFFAFTVVDSSGVFGLSVVEEAASLEYT
jgi:hypothetical protein